MIFNVNNDSVLTISNCYRKCQTTIVCRVNMISNRLQFKIDALEFD